MKSGTYFTTILIYILILCCLGAPQDTEIQNVDFESTANGYTSASNNKYYIETKNKFNWYAAVSECTRKNMNILTIDNAEKAREIKDLINSNFKEQEKPLLYIGGSDLAEPGKFIWHSTGHIFEYTNWGQEEPNNFDQMEHCVHIGLYDDSLWNDINCNNRFGFICEEIKNQQI
ncbi:C-type lectin 16-like [Haematobia irritans]|uniref:C-type lectin 16-like n=1 Tax=Haematobia irritans TaxID=7368 RepID=UPI003F507646